MTKKKTPAPLAPAKRPRSVSAPRAPVKPDTGIPASARVAAKPAPVVVRAKPVPKTVAQKPVKKVAKKTVQPLPALGNMLSKAEQPTSKPLTPAQERFIEEYLIDLNATRAYMAAHPHVKVTTGNVEGCKLLANPKVAAKVQAGKAALSAATGITAERVLKEIASLAYGDARELVEYRVGACRYCWGEGHRFQRTPAEFEHDEAAHDPDKGAFDEKGGVGYSFKKEPHADCPECAGLGKGRMVINDTRNLSPSAVAMYAGVKSSKDGIEVKTHDKVQALDKLARHLGVFKADNEQVKPDGMPPEMIAAAMLSLKKAQNVRGTLMEERRALGFTGD
jgi:phage terminase small subunit